jgi:hypothetical protein
MSDYRIDFSNKEMSLMQDQKFLLTKIEIGKKIEELMRRVERKLYPSIQEYTWPEEVLSKSGKISKGENYQGLPYYMLDFPRKFGKEGIFAFRTMFWWGNFFSATLHLSGKYLENRRGALLTNLETIRSSQAYICVNNTPWDYHYASNNYQSASKFDSPQLHSLLTTKPFMKISFHWPLEIYPELPAVALSTFRQVQGWMIEH